MKFLIIGLTLAVATAACTIQERTTVQRTPAPATTTTTYSTPATASTTTVTTPAAPAATTTVYTR
jgi:hypothetical protein